MFTKCRIAVLCLLIIPVSSVAALAYLGRTDRHGGHAHSGPQWHSLEKHRRWKSRNMPWLCGIGQRSLWPGESCRRGRGSPCDPARSLQSQAPSDTGGSVTPNGVSKRLSHSGIGIAVDLWAHALEEGRDAAFTATESGFSPSPEKAWRKWQKTKRPQLGARALVRILCASYRILSPVFCYPSWGLTGNKMEPAKGIEPATCALRVRRSTN